MSAYQCWLAQREKLRDSLKATGDTSAAAYLVKHALAQVEQNTMAEQTDDLLRQQTGILFACSKTSLNLLDISITTRVWVARQQSVKTSKRRLSFWVMLCACLLQALCGVAAYLQALPLFWVPLCAALAATIAGWVFLRRAPAQEATDEDHLHVTAKPDTEKLFAAIDAQMRAVDRYISDFAYLNEQNTPANHAAELQNLSALAALLETVYGLEADAQPEAVEAVQRLMVGMGVSAVLYGAETARLFTVLPSLGETRTLVPAIVSEQNGALLLRGTAAVLQAEPKGMDVSPAGSTLAQTAKE